MFGQTAAYMIASVQNGKEPSAEPTGAEQATDQFAEQFSGGPIAFDATPDVTEVNDATPVRTLLSEASAWIKDAANGTYLEEATLAEVVTASTVEDFTTTTNVPVSLALTSALLLPFVAAAFAAVAFLAGILFLFNITR